MDKLDHLSKSQVGCWLRCNMQWYYRYIEGIKSPPSGNMTLGLSYHKAHEDNFSQKIETKEDLKDDDVKEIFSEDFEERHKDEVVYGAGESKGTFKDNGVKMVSTYHLNVSPSIKPLAVERKFDIQFDNMDWSLTGFIDLEEEHGITDHKTTGKRPSVLNLGDKQTVMTGGLIDEFNLEASIYLLADKYAFGNDDRQFGWDYTISTKTPYIVRATYNNKPQYEKRVLDTLGKVAGQINACIKSGDFIENTEHPWACNKKFCGYWQKCQGE